MSLLRVDAPGKVVLLGEYAVLDGAPAVVAAIDRGVRCTVRPAPSCLIETPGDDRFVRAALRQAPAAHYAFADWNPTDLPSKPGLGGSAAATVAAVLAAHGVRGSAPSPQAVFREAHAVHRGVQGSGSGIDVAASAHGGVLRFQAGRVQPLALVDPVVVWSGKSAATGPRVARYLAWSGRERFAQASREAVDAFATDPLGALVLAVEALDAMSREAGVDWWTPQLRAIHRIAAEVGGCAKPSGAGGGDVAVALFPTAEARSQFVSGCAAAGFAVISTRVAPGAALCRWEAP